MQGKKRPPFWLDELGSLALRWQSFETEVDIEQAFDTSFPVPVFPALVIFLCARLNAFEPIAAYIMARRPVRTDGFGRFWRPPPSSHEAATRL